ncbi:hypothetical protein N2152v2_011078 [Parachlorella kessleri]
MRQECWKTEQDLDDSGLRVGQVRNGQLSGYCREQGYIAATGCTGGQSDPIITGFDNRRFHFNDVGNSTLLSDAEGYLLEATFVSVAPIKDVTKETSWTSQVRIYNPKGDHIICHLPHILPNTSRIEVSAQAAGSSKAMPMTLSNHTSLQFQDMSANAVLSADPNPVVIGCHVALPKLEVTVYQVSGSEQASQFESERLNFDVKLLKPLSLPVMGILGATYPVTPGAQAALNAISKNSKSVRANVATDPMAFRRKLLHDRTSEITPMSAAQQALLTGQEDAYDGLILDPATLPATPAEFAEMLPTALQSWRDNGYRGIWLQMPQSKAHFVGHAVDAGFEFHHAEKDYVMLTQWLPGGENKLPPNASHQVGVGAFVMNERREVLVVQEKLGPLRGKNVWKMPTGLVQAGEDISAAAEREVLEETGVRARFDSVLAMRQAHGFAFGKSDFFFVVALRPQPGQQELTVQEDELVGAQWMPLEEYVDMPFTQSRPLLRKIAEKCLAYANGTYSGLVGRKLATGFSERQDLLLFGEAASDGDANPDDLWIGLSDERTGA